MIGFSPLDEENISAPHNDSPDITMEIEGYDIRRVFIDTGSVVDIIFLKCFEKIELKVEF